MENLKEKVVQVFCNEGIYISTSDKNVALELDSLQYIKILVALEEEFQITFDDRYLNLEQLDTLNQYITIIENELKKEG